MKELQWKEDRAGSGRVVRASLRQEAPVSRVTHCFQWVRQPGWQPAPPAQRVPIGCNGSWGEALGQAVKKEPSEAQSAIAASGPFSSSFEECECFKKTGSSVAVGTDGNGEGLGTGNSFTVTRTDMDVPDRREKLGFQRWKG